MNRICYYMEDNAAKTELQEVTPVAEDATGKFKVVDKPCYLQIFFARPLEDDELFDLYAVLVEHDIIEMDREKINESIKEDLLKQPMGAWELKCEFKNAMECAERLAEDITFREGGFVFQISDEPTQAMKDWLKVKDFNPENYRYDKLVTVNIDKHNEIDFVSRLITSMVENGATEEEIDGIVKYSMVVIDAEKKMLNWKQAAIDFHVQEMKDKYMSDYSKGNPKTRVKKTKIEEIRKFLIDAVGKHGPIDISAGCEQYLFNTNRETFMTAVNELLAEGYRVVNLQASDTGKVYKKIFGTDEMDVRDIVTKYYDAAGDTDMTWAQYLETACEETEREADAE